MQFKTQKFKSKILNSSCLPHSSKACSYYLCPGLLQAYLANAMNLLQLLNKGFKFVTALFDPPIT